MLGDNEFYISSGAKNAQYTLRVRFEERCADGSVRVRDQYIRNLGIDLDRAKATAALEAGEPVKVVPFELNPYGHATAAELAAQTEADAKRAAREAAQLRYAAEEAEIVRQRRAENALSQWQGAVGERINRKLTCLRWVALGHGAYGMRYLAIFRDEQMNKYVFFGGSVSSLPADGQVAEVTFTVKEHTEHDGCKQTVISRPKKAKEA